MDIVSKATRSRMMASIGPRDTAPEQAVRRYLHAEGMRFRLHERNLPGRPDLVLRKHRAVIFVHGCFWHRHKGCVLAAVPRSNALFWRRKLDANRERDGRHIAALRSAGWRVAVFWECGARKGVADLTALRALERWVLRGGGFKEFPTSGSRAAA